MTLFLAKVSREVTMEAYKNYSTVLTIRTANNQNVTENYIRYSDSESICNSLQVKFQLIMSMVELSRIKSTRN